MSRRTILLVEDDPILRELTGYALRAEGHDVVEVEDGVEAIRALDERDPPADGLSLVLLDMMLPGMDGLGVLGHLAALGVCLPVVAMSASQTMLSAAVAAGVQAVLPKPFELNQLLSIVAGCCNRHD